MRLHHHRSFFLSKPTINPPACVLVTSTRSHTEAPELLGFRLYLFVYVFFFYYFLNHVLLLKASEHVRKFSSCLIRTPSPRHAASRLRLVRPCATVQLYKNSALCKELAESPAGIASSLRSGERGGKSLPSER